MTEYKKRILEARKQFINLNMGQEKELFKIYNDSGNKLIDKILNMTDSRTKTHNIETYKIINEYRTELYQNLNKTIENNIWKSSDIQKGVQLSFVDVIAPNVKINEALKRIITKVSNDTVKQLIAGEYYKDGKTLSKRIWNLTGDNGNKIDAIIKDNIAKGANVRELAKELEKYVKPKNRITPKTFADGIGGDNISYQARRLARTSITHSQTETMIQNAKKNPFCLGLKWNLSASHSARMHGKSDVCDNYNGKIFKPEEVPLQHANCLCYFTEVLEDFDKCIEKMNNWSNGKSNPDIDEWVKTGDDKTSIKVTTPDHIQTKMKLNNIPLEKVKNGNNIIGNVYSKDGKILTNPTVPKFNMDNSEYNKGLNEMANLTMEKAHSKGIECLSIINNLTGAYIYELGKNNKVMFTEEMHNKLIENLDNSMAMMHNHPTGGKPTVADIYNFALYPAIQDSIILLGNKKALLLGWQNEKVSYEEMVNVSRELAKQYVKSYGKKVRKGLLTAAEANNKIELKVAQDLIKKYNIRKVRLG